MKRNRIRNWIISLILVIVVLGISNGFILWFDVNSHDDRVSLTDFRSSESTSERYSQKLCRPGNLPVELSLDLLNDPQSSGDVADFEFGITSLVDLDHISAYFVTPNGATRISGENWAGVLALKESKLLQAGIKLNTEDAITIIAVVEVTKDDSTFIFKNAYHLDLGEKEYASLEVLAISGFAGADSLNLIVPKP